MGLTGRRRNVFNEIGGGMTAQELMKKIHLLYRKAHAPILSVKGVRRGTAHTISSMVEDVFACYCAGKSKKGYEIWIDPQITIKGERNSSGRRPFLFRPDVCIVHLPTKEVRAIFDLKMDLGHVGSFIPFVKDAVKKLKSKIRAHRGKCPSLFDVEGNEYPLKFSSSLKWAYILCSDGNIPKDKFQSINMDMKAFSKTASIFNIIEGHLNQDKFKARANVEALKRLDQYLGTIFDK